MRKRPICIIDDDEDVRAVLGFALEFEGMPSIHFESAMKAVEYLRTLSYNEVPCLNIVDYMMPDMTGIEFIQFVRNRYPQTIGDIPIALSSARISDKDEKFPEGVILLPKPLELPDLISVAKEHYHSSPKSYSSL